MKGCNPIILESCAAKNFVGPAFFSKNLDPFENKLWKQSWVVLCVVFFCVLWENPMRIFPPPSKMQDKSDLATPHFHKYLKLSITPCYSNRLSLMITSRRSRDDYSNSRSSQPFWRIFSVRTSAEIGNRAKGWQIFQNGFAKFGFQPASFG